MKPYDDSSSEAFFADILRRQKFRESHYTLVGHIVVQFGTIESILSSFVAQVINQDDFVPALLALNKLSLVNILDIARSIFALQEKNVTMQIKFESILRIIDELRIKRNGIIHSSWEYDVDNQSVGYVRILPDKRTKIQFKDTSYTIQEFKELNSAVLSASNKLLHFATSWLKRQQPNVKL